MKKFCEDEGYDYWKFCKLAHEGKLEMETKSITENQPDFIGSPITGESGRIASNP